MAKVKGCPKEEAGAVREVRPPCSVETELVHLKKGGGCIGKVHRGVGTGFCLGQNLGKS